MFLRYLDLHGTVLALLLGPPVLTRAAPRSETVAEGTRSKKTGLYGEIFAP